MINFCDIGGDYRNRLINDMNFYLVEGCKLDNLISEANKI